VDHDRTTNHLRIAVAACAGIIAALALTGCFGREKPDIKSPDAALKIPAIKARVAQHDPNVIPQLISDLCSDDPAVRFYAIEGLERLTNQTFGYRYFDDEIRRKPALNRWRAWLANQSGDRVPTTAPSQPNPQ
jgi:hypothetical protein